MQADMKSMKRSEIEGKTQGDWMRGIIGAG